ncbi:MAG TPA: hypothetical protein VHD84_02875 [Candidatus Saccharimonadales bacterium]|nr:hypothetical protein [Candidatus Saccharimonadales bacterium]
MENKELLAKLVELLKLDDKLDQLRDNEITPLIAKIEACEVEMRVTQRLECPADAAAAERQRDKYRVQLGHLKRRKRALEEERYHLLSSLARAAQ